MPVPPVVVAVGVKILESAAEKLGSRIGESIAEGIFGKSTDLIETQGKLNAISHQLNEVLHFTRATYILVEKIPDIVTGLIDQQTLYLAHNDIESSYEAYQRLTEWHGTIGYDSLTKILSAWNIVIDKESSIEKIILLPRYGEFMMVITNGQLYIPIKSGCERKLNAIISAIKFLVEEKLNPCLIEAEHIISSDHISNGKLLTDSPWLTWTMKKYKTKTEKECISKPCHYCNGDIVRCHDVHRPDVTWNSAIDIKNARLSELTQIIDGYAKELRTAFLARATLSRYVDILKARGSQTLNVPHIRVVESNAMFPDLVD